MRPAAHQPRPTARRGLLLGALLVGALGTASVAQAQNDDSRARELYLRGDRLYNEGRYEEAVTAFREAHDLSGRPLLLFNLANAYERLGRYEEALDALRRYAPNAPVSEEDQIRARIANLSRRAEEQRAAEHPDAPPPEQPDPNEPTVATPVTPPATPPPASGPDMALVGAGGAILGVGALLVVGGAVFGALALGAGDELEGECVEGGSGAVCRESASDLLDQERTYALLADIGLFGGAAVATAGLVLLIVGLTSSGGEDTQAARPTVGISANGMEVGVVSPF